MTKTFLLTAAALAAFSAPAQAQDGTKGAYVAAGGTYSIMPEVDSFVDNAPAPGQQVHVVNTMDDGWGGWAAIGYDLGRPRIEAQVGYVSHHGELSTAVDPFPGRELNQHLEQDEWRVMANAYFDFIDGPVTPFVGAGAGMVFVQNIAIGPRLPFPDEDPIKLIDDKDSRFAWQAMAGIDAKVGERASIVAQYRYLDAGEVDGVDIRNERFTREHRAHHIDLGLRYRF